MPRNHSHSDTLQPPYRFARLRGFSLLAALAVLLLLGAMPARYSLVQAQAAGASGKIAFVSDREGSDEIYTVNLDGSNLKKLTNLGGCYGPVWSPDGNKIAFTHSMNGYSRIYSMNADGSSLTQLYVTEVWPAHQRDPKWSPDGTRIAFVHEGRNAWNYEWEIYVMDATTGDVLGNYSYDQPYWIVTKDTDPVWSPDGTKIAYLRDFGNHFPNREVFVIDLTNGQRRQLTSGGNYCTEPAWSPDGARLAFTRAIPGGRYNRLHVINADGTNLVAPAADLSSFDEHPIWSPDGTRIAFEHSLYDAVTYEFISGGISIATPNVLGSLPIAAIAPAGYAPSWSPDGQSLTFTGKVVNFDLTDQSEIFIADLGGGGDLARLTNNEAYDYGSAWQPTPLNNTPVGTDVTVNFGQIKLKFDNITAPGLTNIRPVDPSTLSETLPAGYLIYNNHAFEITTTATFSGSVTIGFQIQDVSDAATFALLRVLHGEGGQLVDRTVLAPDQPAPDFSSITIHARVASLSPFVIAQFGSLDQTAPNVTATTSTQPNSAGWYNSDTVLTLTATDEAGGSGVSSISYFVNGDGGGGGGGSDIRADFIGKSKGQSASTAGALVVDNSTVTIPVTTEGMTTISYYATDAAGNQSPQQTITLLLDKTAPTVFVNAPANGAVYRLNQIVGADFDCADNTSGIASCTGTTPRGSNINTSQPGVNSFVVTANDNAGHTVQQVVSYTVEAPPPPPPPSCAANVTNRVRVEPRGFAYDKRTRRFKITVAVTNTSAGEIQGPVSLVIDHLGAFGLSLINKNGVTACEAPVGSPYINLNVGSDAVLKRNESVTLTLTLDVADEKKIISFSTRLQARVLAGDGTR